VTPTGPLAGEGQDVHVADEHRPRVMSPIGVRVRRRSERATVMEVAFGWLHGSVAVPTMTCWASSPPGELRRRTSTRFVFVRSISRSKSDGRSAAAQRDEKVHW
jgi:hypothetical protein